MGRWRGILRALHCRPEQLQKIAAGHRRYVTRMAPVLQQRKGKHCTHVGHFHGRRDWGRGDGLEARARVLLPHCVFSLPPLPCLALPAAAEALEQVQRMTQAQLSHAWTVEANSAVSLPALPALPACPAHLPFLSSCLPAQCLLPGIVGVPHLAPL